MSHLEKFKLWLQHAGKTGGLDASKAIPSSLAPQDWTYKTIPIPPPTPITNHIAIIASTKTLAAAMEQALSEKLKNHTFRHVARISDRWAGTSIATLGMPLIPSNDGVLVYAFRTRFIENATKAERDAQWEIIHNEESSVEEVLAELSGFRVCVILSQTKVVEIKLAIADVKLAIAEAETIEARAEAYKLGFEFLIESLFGNDYKCP